MTKWILATLMTVAAFAAAGPRSAAPKTETETVATGTCRYTCSTNGVTYLNRTRCLSACSGTCTPDVC